MSEMSVPFGKYKGKPISDLINDKKYYSWCKEQPELVKRYPMLLKNDDQDDDEEDEEDEKEQPIRRVRLLPSSSSSEDKWEEKYKKLEQLYMKLEERVKVLENLQK